MSRSCGSRTIGIQLSGDRYPIYRALLCKSWECPLCGNLKRNHWRKLIAKSKPDRFITLTVDPSKGYPDLLAEVMAIKAGVRKLKKRVERAFGSFEYVYIIELTKNKHAHAHLVQRGVYVPQDWLSTNWDECGTGRIVDIRAVKDPAKAARYVSKYMTKGHVEMRKLVEKRARVIQYSSKYFKALGLDPKETRPSASVDLAWIIDKPLVDVDYGMAFRSNYWLPDLALRSFDTGADARRETVGSFWTEHTAREQAPEGAQAYKQGQMFGGTRQL